MRHLKRKKYVTFEKLFVVQKGRKTAYVSSLKNFLCTEYFSKRKERLVLFVVFNIGK
jgi:hypothetical protein